MNQFIPQDNPALQLFTKIAEDFPFSSQDQEYILIEGNVATIQTLQGLQSTHEKMNDDRYVARRPDGSTKTESIVSFIQQAVANNHSLVQVFDIDVTTGLPKTDDDVQQLYDYLYMSNEYGMQVSGLLHKDGNEYTATIFRIYVDLGQDLMALFKERVVDAGAEDAGGGKDHSIWKSFASRFRSHPSRPATPSLSGMDLLRQALRDTSEEGDAKQLSWVFETCIGRVESRGLIRRLSFGNLVLLQPEL